MTQFISNREILQVVDLRVVPQAAERLWIATADIRHIYVDASGRDLVPFLEVLDGMLKRGVGLQLIHAKEPGPNWRDDFDRYPDLGSPGTGKTEFVKYLGKATGGKVLVKMGSDILSKWVGGTKENIRSAFTEAETENAILFLDEIDGLVQDRTMAGHSWEVTQVNELLYQMENFKGMMVGATNFMSNLDAAIMRRFTFKLQFDYLEDERKRHDNFDQSKDGWHFVFNAYEIACYAIGDVEVVIPR